MKLSTLCIALIVLGCTFASAQPQFNVVYSFGANGGALDGNFPNGGMVADVAGNLYGSTTLGGANCTDCGTVFELSPSGTGWTETILYSFCQSGYPTCLDGAAPESGLIRDGSGNLYGTTIGGGTGPCMDGEVAGCGTIFELTPSTSGWSYSVLYNFEGSPAGDACFPQYEELAFDKAGDIYGVTDQCGAYGFGTVFELSPSNGRWTESVVYSFCPVSPCPDGALPYGGVAVDAMGNLFGTAAAGGNLFEFGVAFELSPTSGGGWTETVLHDFGPKNGVGPSSPVTFDQAGNLYSTTSAGGLRSSQCANDACGSVFRLTPPPRGPKLLFFLFDGTDGGNPQTGVVVNGDVLYGTTLVGKYRSGEVYQIRGKSETVIHTFCAQNGCPDGEQPSGMLTISGGKLYGATSKGGAFNQGTIFSITP
jgi:uncharacterized repeat protein (TIGR03803 family)